LQSGSAESGFSTGNVMSIVYWQQSEDGQLWFAGHRVSGEGHGAAVAVRSGEQHACVANV